MRDLPLRARHRGGDDARISASRARAPAVGDGGLGCGGQAVDVGADHCAARPVPVIQSNRGRAHGEPARGRRGRGPSAVIGGGRQAAPERGGTGAATAASVDTSSGTGASTDTSPTRAAAPARCRREPWSLARPAAARSRPPRRLSISMAPFCVSTTAMMSPRFTRSPGCFSHSTSVPASMSAPSDGMRNCPWAQPPSGAEHRLDGRDDAAGCGSAASSRWRA